MFGYDLDKGVMYVTNQHQGTAQRDDRGRTHLEPHSIGALRHVVDTDPKIKDSLRELGTNPQADFMRAVIEAAQTTQDGGMIDLDKIRRGLEQAQKASGINGASLAGAGMGGNANLPNLQQNGKLQLQ